MITCPQCGATLADNAQYCMQCGTPAQAARAAADSLGTDAFLGPAVIFGSAMGVLSSVPLVNCLCCAWMLGGGAAAAWMVGRNTGRGPQGMTYGDGAFAGVLTGIWGSLVATLAAILPRFLFPDLVANQQEALDAILTEYPTEVAAEVRQIIEILASDPPSLLGILVILVSNLLIYGLLAMIGGIILVGVLRKSSPSPGSAPD